MKWSVKTLQNKIIAIGFISLLAVSIYLVWENNALYNYYQELRELYEKLAEKHENIYRETIYNLTSLMPKGLDEHYERIRMYASKKFTNEGDPGRLLFYSTQVLHDLGNYTYDQYCSEFNKTVGIECKNLTMNFPIDFLGYINRSYPNTGRMEQVYNWVNYFVSYVNDTSEFERFPIETLVNRYGDCEDQAMALCFLLESCGYETALCMIHDKNLTKYGPDGLHHVFCVVRKNGFEYNGTLIQLHRYSEYGNSWIVLDAAFSHLFGEDAEWMDNYRMENGTVYIPPTVWDSLLIDSTELAIRAEEIGITLDD